VYESEGLRNWICGHVDAFRFYGALPEVVVPDNPKTAVEKACRYEPLLNPTYAELAQFYGLVLQRDGELQLLPDFDRVPLPIE
jgi:transposase